jgi:hypothetical protein
MFPMSFICVLLLLLQAVQSSPVLGIPGAPGVYFRQDEKNWTAIPKASFAQTKMKGLDSFVYTGGFTNLGADASIPGAKSSIRISNRRPMFYARAVGRAKDVRLIRLTQNGKSRAFHTSTGNETVENKEGFRKSDLRKTIVTEYPDGTYSVQPENDLKPGEYLLVLGDAATSFDFGVDARK